MTPKLTRLCRDDTHRLVPARYGEESVLGRLAEDDADLQALFDLEGATNGRLLGEANRLPGISVHELLFGVSNAHIINAAFTHARPGGGRFNSPARGAWYAAFELETAQAESVFHKREELAEIGWRDAEVFTFTDYFADFRAGFHDLRGDPHYADCLSPASYSTSQALAAELLAAGSAGVVYESARLTGGDCLACFRPALVTNVRCGRGVTIGFRDFMTPPIISVT